MKVIITGCFRHETNRYALGVTDFKKYAEREATFDGQGIMETWKTERLHPFYNYFADKEEYRLIPVMIMNASPGPVVAQEVWEKVKDSLLEAIDAEDHVDGILLGLHGAMVTEKFEDGEGELLEVLRNKVGKDVPIVASLDLHANMTAKMVANANALFAYDYYPHTDMYETDQRAADCIYRTLEGEINPVLCFSQQDLILPYMPTSYPAFAPFLAEAQSYRNNGKMIDVSICHGFFASDIYQQGLAVIAVADGDTALAQKTADTLGAKLFAARKELRRQFLTAEEAVKEAMASEKYPVVLAEVADNPGSGASADAPLLLKTLIENKAESVAFSLIRDPEVVEIAVKAGVGSTIHVKLGGKKVPELTGGPIECDAYVKYITDGNYRNRDKMNQGNPVRLGKSVLLQIGGISVVVCSFHVQTYDLEVYRHFGIHPEDMKILVVKSAAHFRASFGNVASKILDVATPALAPMNPEDLPLARSRRPIYPLDEI